MDEISLVRSTRRTLAKGPFVPSEGAPKALLAVESSDPPFFRAVMAATRPAGPDGIEVAAEVWDHLGLRPDRGVVVLPLEERGLS
jgi:hypothetical protein